MEEMIEQFATQMAEKVGISQDQAKMVIGFLKDNADQIPKLLGSDAAEAVKDKLPGGLGDLF